MLGHSRTLDSTLKFGEPQLTYGKGFDTETPYLGRGMVPEFLLFFVLFGGFLWAPGRFPLFFWPYFRVCAAVAVFQSTETSS